MRHMNRSRQSKHFHRMLRVSLLVHLFLSPLVLAASMESLQVKKSQMVNRSVDGTSAGGSQQGGNGDKSGKNPPNPLKSNLLSHLKKHKQKYGSLVTLAGLYVLYRGWMAYHSKSESNTTSSIVASRASSILPRVASSKSQLYIYLAFIFVSFLILLLCYVYVTKRFCCDDTSDVAGSNTLQANGLADAQMQVSRAQEVDEQQQHQAANSMASSLGTSKIGSSLSSVTSVVSSAMSTPEVMPQSFAEHNDGQMRPVASSLYPANSKATSTATSVFRTPSIAGPQLTNSPIGTRAGNTLAPTPISQLGQGKKHKNDNDKPQGP